MWPLLPSPPPAPSGRRGSGCMPRAAACNRKTRCPARQIPPECRSRDAGQVQAVRTGSSGLGSKDKMIHSPNGRQLQRDAKGSPNLRPSPSLPTNNPPPRWDRPHSPHKGRRTCGPSRRQGQGWRRRGAASRRLPPRCGRTRPHAPARPPPPSPEPGSSARTCLSGVGSGLGWVGRSLPARQAFGAWDPAARPTLPAVSYAPPARFRPPAPRRGTPPFPVLPTEP